MFADSMGELMPPMVSPLVGQLSGWGIPVVGQKDEGPAFLGGLPLRIVDDNGSHFHGASESFVLPDIDLHGDVGQAEASLLIAGQVGVLVEDEGLGLEVFFGQGFPPPHTGRVANCWGVEVHVVQLGQGLEDEPLVTAPIEEEAEYAPEASTVDAQFFDQGQQDVSQVLSPLTNPKSQEALCIQVEG